MDDVKIFAELDQIKNEVKNIDLQIKELRKSKINLTEKINLVKFYFYYNAFGINYYLLTA